MYTIHYIVYIKHEHRNDGQLVTHEIWVTTSLRHIVAGFLGYPQPGGGAHPPIPSEGGLGEVLWRLG